MRVGAILLLLAPLPHNRFGVPALMHGRNTGNCKFDVKDGFIDKIEI